jgi:hypothetical protein
MSAASHLHPGAASNLGLIGAGRPRRQSTLGRAKPSASSGRRCAGHLGSAPATRCARRCARLACDGCRSWRPQVDGRAVMTGSPSRLARCVRRDSCVTRAGRGAASTSTGPPSKRAAERPGSGVPTERADLHGPGSWRSALRPGAVRIRLPRRGRGGGRDAVQRWSPRPDGRRSPARPGLALPGRAAVDETRIGREGGGAVIARHAAAALLGAAANPAATRVVGWSAPRSTATAGGRVRCEGAGYAPVRLVRLARGRVGVMIVARTSTGRTVVHTRG